MSLIKKHYTIIYIYEPIYEYKALSVFLNVKKNLPDRIPEKYII